MSTTHASNKPSEKPSLIDSLEQDASSLISQANEADATEEIAELREALKEDLPARLAIAEGHILWTLLFLAVAAFILYQVGNDFSKALFGATLLGEDWPYEVPLNAAMVIRNLVILGLAGWAIHTAIAPQLRRNDPLLIMTPEGVQFRGMPEVIGWEAVHGVDINESTYRRSRFTVNFEPDYRLAAPPHRVPGIKYQPDAHRITIKTFEPALKDAANVMNAYAWQAHARARLAELGA